MPAIGYSLPAVHGTSLTAPPLPGASLLPPDVFHHLGQYSPWFPADADLPRYDVPQGCSVVFVNQLERHGSRYPTGGAFKDLSRTLRQVAKHLQRVPDADPNHRHGQGLDSDLKWLRHWVNPKKRSDGGLRNRIGDSELVPFGQYEAYSSGRRFYERYADLFESEHVDINLDFAQHSNGKQEDIRFRSLLQAACPTQLNPSPPASYSSTLQLHHHVRQKICHYLGFAPSAAESRREKRPFVRASGGDRVVATSRFWLQGFKHSPHKPFQHAPPESAPWPPKGRPAVIGELKSGKPHRRIHNLPEPDVIIPEVRKIDDPAQPGSNNTLDVHTCSAFEHQHRDNAQSPASLKKDAFAKTATAEIRRRLARQLGKDHRGDRLHLKPQQVLQLFSLCAFDTVARLDPYGLLYDQPERNEGAVSPFCSLFKPDEFVSIYEVTTNMEKDYGFATHQPFHRALATPWLRELVARLERRAPVMSPPTSINTTLDEDPKTFPLPSETGPRAFVDFTHDNQLAPVIASLGLWGEEQSWKTSLTTPFSGRMTVEQLVCNATDYVRVLVNDAPANVSQGKWCPGAGYAPVAEGDQLCPLPSFLESLQWVDRADEWNKCDSEDLQHPIQE